MPPGREKQRKIKARAPIWSLGGRVRIPFTTDLDTDWLPPNFEDLADYENDGHGPFPVLGGSGPVRCSLRIECESRMSLRRVCNKGLNKHLVNTLAIFLDHDRPELIHQRTHRPGAGLLQNHQRWP